jgi:hypothetical protein
LRCFSAAWLYSWSGILPWERGATAPRDGALETQPFWRPFGGFCRSAKAAAVACVAESTDAQQETRRPLRGPAPCEPRAYYVSGDVSATSR